MLINNLINTCHVRPYYDQHDALVNAVVAYAALNPVRQAFVRDLCARAFLRTRPHRDPKREGSVSFYSEELKAHLGNGYPDVLAHFFDFERGRLRGSSAGLTKEYVVRPEIRARVQEHLESHPATAVDLDDAGRRIRRVPRYGVLRTDYDGKQAVTSIEMAPTVEVNVVRLQELLDAAKRARNVADGFQRALILGGFGVPANKLSDGALDHLIICAAKVVALAKAAPTPEGTILSLYKEATSGRLYGQGVHLMTVNKPVRHAALHGMGYADYDIEACHPAIAHNLARSYGVKAPVLAALVDDRKAFRSHVAAETGMGGDAVKRCLTALMYGARLNPHEKGAFGTQGESYDRRRAFCEHPLVRALREELEGLTDEALARAEGTRTRHGVSIRNAVGKSMLIEGRTIDRPKKKSKRMAHLMQGWEAAALRATWREVREQREGAILLCHDGWISKEIDEKKVEMAIENETGFKLRVDKGELS